MAYLLLSLAASAVAQSSNFVCTGKPIGQQYTAKTQDRGCYTDGTQRTLTGYQTDLSQNTPQTCANVCANLGYTYSGTEYGTQCFCGNQLSSPGAATTSDKCNYACPGSSSSTCGGYYTISVLQITNPNPNPPSTSKKFIPVCKTDPFCAQKACDTSLSIADRVKALVSNMTLTEKAANMINTANGAQRIGLPSYQWWNEALHGTGNSPGVSFASPNGSAYSYATSFAMPILIGAAFDDDLVLQIAQTVGKESRAFANGNHAGRDFWTPNINTFNDPRWGRGLEVPTEDVLHMQQYVKQVISGLQATTNPAQKQVVATCKHYAVYDVETNRNGQNYNPTQQDLGDYYLPAFKTCVRDSGVGSVMCSYNAVDGVPSCANEYLLQTVLRDHWGFGKQPYNYVTGDCDAVNNIYDSHKFTDSASAASAVAINAGTDTDCGATVENYNTGLITAVNNGWTTNATIDRSLSRLYTALFTVGYFDGQSQFDSLGWADVSTGAAQTLAYTSAGEGMTLLKNNGALPIAQASSQTVALIGPWANATKQMQGNYEGVAPYLKSPYEAARATFRTVNYAQGTQINTQDTSGYSAATTAAQNSDIIIFCGGIDTSIEFEGVDRSSISWPGNQLDLIASLSKLGKPLIVVQFGGGQVDDSSLLSNTNVNSLLWAGYPGQDGGYAVMDTLVGKLAPAGRLPITQYPANYTSQISLFDPNMRLGSNNPGRTYKWYNGQPVLPFGHGLHYTTFTAAAASSIKSSYSISSLTGSGQNDASAFATLQVTVTNTGRTTSDYVGLLYVQTTNAGPSPYPNKSLVAYARAKSIAASQSKTISLNMTLGSIARANSDGDLVLYPGTYSLTFDNDAKVKAQFTLTGQATVIDMLPRRAASYNYTVPVHPQS